MRGRVLPILILRGSSSQGGGAGAGIPAFAGSVIWAEQGGRTPLPQAAFRASTVGRLGGGGDLLLDLPANASAMARTLKLSPFHFMAASRVASPACAVLAAGAAGGNGADAGLQAAWTAAAQELDWAREHVMRLPTDLAPGMVAWLAGPEGGAATPACNTSVNGTWEAGAFSPFVRARGLVVDGVVASPHVRGGYIWGRLWLPKSADPLALGPRLTWRINRHPLFGAWDMGNILLGNLAGWGELAAVVVTAVVLVRALLRRRSSKLASEPKRKAE
ncbi:hypothetical protein ABPG75_002622 [Micractinium tetrahymenae]